MNRYVFLGAIVLFLLDVFVWQAQAKEFNEVFDDVHEDIQFCGNGEEVGYFLGEKYGLLPVTAGNSFNMITNTYHLTVFAASPDLSTIAILTQYGNKVCLTSLSVGHKKMIPPTQ
jgi:hypothetical protein